MGHCGMSVLVGDGPNSKNPAPFSDFFLIFFFFFFFFRVTPTAYGGSQARGQTGAIAASLWHRHSNARSKPRL